MVVENVVRENEMKMKQYEKMLKEKQAQIERYEKALREMAESQEDTTYND